MQAVARAVGAALPFAPKVTFNVNPEYEWAVGGGWRAFVGGNAQYQSKRFSNIEGVFLSVPLEAYGTVDLHAGLRRSEEHTSELQSLMRISYAVFCLKNNSTLKIHDRSDSTFDTKRCATHS